LFARKRLVHAEVFAVEYGEREVHVDAHRLGSALPHQIRAQHLVGARERDGPFLVAARKLLGRDVPVRVPGHRLGHYEREHVRLSAVRQLNQPVQQRHGGLAIALLGL